jgi:hypothetical protein
MNATNSVSMLVMVTAWVCGIALAKGFWMTAVCFVLPPVAWVLLAEHLMGVAA